MVCNRHLCQGEIVAGGNGPTISIVLCRVHGDQDLQREYDRSHPISIVPPRPQLDTLSRVAHFTSGCGHTVVIVRTASSPGGDSRIWPATTLPTALSLAFRFSDRLSNPSGENGLRFTASSCCLTSHVSPSQLRWERALRQRYQTDPNCLVSGFGVAPSLFSQCYRGAPAVTTNTTYRHREKARTQRLGSF